MRRALVVLAVAAAAVVNVVPGGRAADAAAVVAEVGWWTRATSNPASADVAEVAQAPDGELSVTAVRLRVSAASLSKAVVILQESGGVRPDGAAIIACRATSSWTAAKGGPLEEAPEADCGGSVPLTRDANAATWVADVRSLVPAGAAEASIVLVPGPSTLPVPVDPGWQVRASGIAVDAAGSGTAGGASSPSAGPEPSSASAGSGVIASAGEGSGSTLSSTLASTFTVPTDSGSVVVTTAPPADTAAQPTDAAASSGDASGGSDESTETAFEPLTSTGRRASQPWGRLILFVPLAAAVGAAGGYVKLRGLGFWSQ